jgi:hypothetical protein
LNVGIPTVIEGRSPSGLYSAVFEDDGETGYFYALDRGRGEQPIVDAMQIYNVQSVIDRHNPTAAEIRWSSDAMKSALILNGVMHALFDFSARRGYCRTGYPAPSKQWSKFDHSWSDDVPKLLD